MDTIPSLPDATTARPRFSEKGRAFPAVPEAVPACRRIIRAGLLAHGLAGLSDDASAVTAELTANAVNAMRGEQRAGRPGSRPPIMVLNLEWLAAGVRIGVWDDAPGIPGIEIAARDAETGRGLSIVDALTSGRWGWFAASTGKWVWAECVRPAYL